ncbi:MAG: phosphate signaling complex protein PhoU [Dehalococcoidia bacterium]|nr:phosphate signaling complex protein PhoU [Dehalococcoidia bacterium]
MGGMAGEALVKAMVSLAAQDEDAAREVIHNDGEVNKKRFQIEEAALNLLALQAPMASDLRTIAAVLQVISDLERIGDHAVGIAKIVLMHGGQPRLDGIDDLERMADRAGAMLERALHSFSDKDADTARVVCDQDDEVDALYDRFYHEMLRRMIEDRSLIERATYLIWASHNIERIADRATNVAERVIFLVTGRMQELNVSSY